MTEQQDPIKLVNETSARQLRAAKPDLSAWVSANAGSGKTHVLSQRVVRLLLNGTPPSAILCLTYTKAAAAEMSNRIFSKLADWTNMNDEELKRTIEVLEGHPPSSDKLRFARRLFANALETPGGLKIQTIHAFCEALLHRFPLEANVPGHFEVLDEKEAENLTKEARRLVFINAVDQPGSKLADSINYILEHAGEFGLEQLLDQIIGTRHKLSDFMSFSDEQSNLYATLRTRLGVDNQTRDEDILKEIWPLPDFDDETIITYYNLAKEGKNKGPKQFSTVLWDTMQVENPVEKLAILKDGLMTKAGAPKKTSRAVSADITDIIPDLAIKLEVAQHHLLEIDDKLKRHACLTASNHAMVLARAFIDIFEGLKKRQAKLDYDDLIIHTSKLFKKGGAGSWVHYKLDQGIDHILLDEAQDTSPDQWSVIQSLASEFYSGQSAREMNRTIFAVGDEKQSIYSFQGAKPERFDQEKRSTAKRVAQADKNFDSIALRVSFRSTPEVLNMVDFVFQDAAAKKGLSFSEDEIIHQSVRQNAPGRVELWDMLAKQPDEDSEDWLAPFDNVSAKDPVNILSRQIAALLSEWVGHEYILDQKSGRPRPIRAGDILVLVRKRDSFVPTLMRTLKKNTNIPVAGADRLRLTDHIAVQDLIALGRTILLHEDDLFLSCLLKSTLFNMSEEELFDLCAKRTPEVSVWRSLELASEKNQAARDILKKITELEVLARSHTVHDFYNYVLGPWGARQKFMDRNGYEVTDILDGFLDAAFEHDQNGSPGLQSFLATLSQSKPEIKREQEQGTDALRIMTVHASKGLEAPIVFLIDPGSKPYNSRHTSALRELENEAHLSNHPSPYLWVPKSNFENSVTAELKQKVEEKAEEEYRRLLYVGLTRAADRLIVCGYRGQRESNKPTWHKLVENGFNLADAGTKTEITYKKDDLEWNALRYSISDHVKLDLHRVEEQTKNNVAYERPACLNKPVKKVNTLPRPLVPSGVGSVIEDEFAMQPKQAPFSTSYNTELYGADYGKAVHRLLQVLPDLPQNEWEQRGMKFLSSALPTSDENAHRDIMAQLEGILTRPGWAPLFTNDSASEFSVMGTITIDSEERIVSGRIDRLVVLEDRVLILDYKTNKHAPVSVEDVPSSYLSQLAIYRAVLTPLYPNRKIEAALLYTRIPTLIPIPENELNDAIRHLCSN